MIRFAKEASAFLVVAAFVAMMCNFSEIAAAFAYMRQAS